MSLPHDGSGGGSSDSARYERMGGGGGGAGAAWLATVTRRRLYDEAGRLVEVRSVYERQHASAAATSGWSGRGNVSAKAHAPARELRSRAGARQCAHRQEQVLITPASCAEYDDALLSAPALCRPLAAAMGDRRPAVRCLADSAVDRAAGLAGAARRCGGSGVADRLAAAVTARFAAAAACRRRAVLLEDGSLF